jgi:hypothetical protein
MDGIYILFATTDEFFNDEKRGVVTYPALKTRITTSNTLELPSIGGNEMVEIAKNVRDICQCAWKQNLRIENSQLTACAKIAEDTRIPSAIARTYVKSLIKLFDNISDGKTDDPLERFREIYNSTFDEVAIERENFDMELS